MSHQRASESVDLVNDHDHVTDISENTGSGKVIRYSGEDCDLSDFFDSEARYYCETSLEAIGGNLYKFRDDSVIPRRFLGTDDEDDAILLDHEGHSLHEIINGDKPLRPIIDFDLPRNIGCNRTKTYIQWSG